MPILVTFVIDGFNLYHSIRDIERETGANCLWLDVHSLCTTLVSSSLGPGHALEAMHYRDEDADGQTTSSISPGRQLLWNQGSRGP
jgi:hypothetical protein